ncbi:hypothetical protein [uncultured Sutterella sp.]|uniref:hypothetical protein n=1 Tax=uncultured Sutterella sp. TaxID=286133 RepID=UPI00262824AA|nr:hypothetical protein [uncultured Sutterella sp.]
MKKSSIWRQAYSDFLKSGLSRAQFYRSHIEHYFPKVRPSLSALYGRFQQFDREAALSEAAAPETESTPEQTVVVRQLGENIQLAEIKSEAAVFRPSSAAHRPAVSAAAGSQELPFRIRLPNGVLFEFMTPSPERSAVVLAEALR